MKNMTIKEILQADLDKNYPDMQLDVDEYAQDLADSITNEGYQLFRDGNLLIVYKDLGNKSAEFHVINGAHKVDDMIQRVYKILIQLQMDGFTEVQIPYDNPSLEKIIKKIPVFPKTTEKVDEGTGRTYVTKVRIG